MKTAAELAQPAWEQLGGLQCDEIWEALKSVAQLAVDARRLVEEAQADAKKHALVNVALRAEVDRLKGELAEARRLLLDCDANARLPETVRINVRAFLAATPAEQAQGEGAKPTGVLDAVWPTIHGLEQHYREVRALVAALAKRMDGLEAFRAEVDSWTAAYRTMTVIPPPTDYAHHHTFQQWSRPGWPDTCGAVVRGGDSPHCGQPEAWSGHVKAAPEAAGPGHVFECRWKSVGETCGADCSCKHCGILKPVHAVPPIPEGGAR